MTRQEKINLHLAIVKKGCKNHTPIGAVYRERFYTTLWSEKYPEEGYITIEELNIWHEQNKK